jgi:lysophospholipase L1-like esterase
MSTRSSRVTTFAIAVAMLVGMLLNGPTARPAPYDPAPFDMATADTPVSRIALIGDSYTNGTAIGGQGPNAWPNRAWKILAREGLPVSADVAAEGRAGYAVRGDQGNMFGDLTAQAVKPDDALVVFYGSRNDQGVDPNILSGLVYNAFAQARATAPGARLLVIGPPWPTADVPPAVLQIRDVLAFQAMLAGAAFIDPIAERWFVDRPDLIGRDGVHPTDAGHVYQADRIAPLIGAQLPRRT